MLFFFKNTHIKTACLSRACCSPIRSLTFPPLVCGAVLKNKGWTDPPWLCPALYSQAMKQGPVRYSPVRRCYKTENVKGSCQAAHCERCSVFPGQLGPQDPPPHCHAPSPDAPSPTPTAACTTILLFVLSLGQRNPFSYIFWPR